jgi:hypothetical protein
MKGKLALAVLLASLYLFFNGCSDNNDSPVVSQSKINVTGRVIGYLFNQGLPYAKIRIEDKIVTADQFGKFYIPDVKTPYTIYVSDSASNRGCIFEGLNEPECYLKFVDGSSPNELHASINVAYSGNIETSNERKIFFTDGKNVNGIGSDFSCRVYLPDNTPVAGKVCYLLYTTNSQGKVLTYDKFGYIDNVSLTPNANINLTFNDSICSFNPGSVSVSGSINTTSGIYAISTVIISPRHSNFFVTNILLDIIIENTFNILLPANLSVNYYPLMFIQFQDYSSGLYCQSFYSLPKAGGTGIVLTAPSTPQIISPPENSPIDSNTVFSFSGTGSQEFFQLTFSDSIRTVKFITSSNSVTLASMYKLGMVRFSANSQIKFEVTAISPFNSIDEYVNPNINNLVHRSSFPVSREYYVKP